MIRSAFWDSTSHSIVAPPRSNASASCFGTVVRYCVCWLPSLSVYWVSETVVRAIQQLAQESDYAASAARALTEVGQVLGTVLEVVGRLVSRATADCSRGSSRDEWRGHAKGVAAAAAEPAAPASSRGNRAVSTSVVVVENHTCGCLGHPGSRWRSFSSEAWSPPGVGDDRGDGPHHSSPTGA